uniref:Uncharacterized protein n=1 Tax=viral metagenome TaxID=1070528 RepID=A0A6C0AEF8_9ZZZZ
MDYGWIIFLVFLVISIIIIVILIVFNQFNPYIPPSTSAINTETMEQLYVINSPWGWDNKGNNSIPVEGDSGKCNVYTFKATSQFTPATFSFDSMKTCVANSTCTFTSSDSSTCIDEDQLFASQRQHLCRGNTGATIDNQVTDQSATITSGSCLQQDGIIVGVGTVEKYYTKCFPQTSESSTINTTNNNNKCLGSLGLIGFNITQGVIGPSIFNNAVCMSTPEYTYSNGTYSNLSPVKQAPCSIQTSYGGYPSELFRIERASFNGLTFTFDQAGSFCKIIHRPTNYLLSPVGLPTEGGLLELIPINNIKNSGYVWLFSENVSFNANGIDISANTQLVYIPDPKNVPSTQDLNIYLSYMMQQFTVTIDIIASNPPGRPRAPATINPGISNTIVVNPPSQSQTKSPNPNGNLKMGKFLTYNKYSSYDSNLINMNTVTYLNYGLLPMLLSNPSNFFD